MVNPTGWPSIANRILAGRIEPSTCCKPEPLSDITCPEILNDVPATGFSSIGSITKNVRERTLIVENVEVVASKSELPENIMSTVVKPSGWDNGIE